MADKPLRESQHGKKRRAEALELEKEAEEWTAPTASGSAGGVRKIRLGKRFQAVLPALQTSTTANPSSTTPPDVRVNLPRRIFSAQALQESVNSSDVTAFLQFASTLSPGYVHATPHATTANALHILHQHNWNVSSASCHLLASHAYAPPPSSSPVDNEDHPKLKKQHVPVKHQQWLVSFYLAFATPVFTETSLESLRTLHRTCPLADHAAEATALRAFLSRVDAWVAAAEEATTTPNTDETQPTPSRKSSSKKHPPSGLSTSPADLHALLHTATALRCHDLPVAHAMTSRLNAFELAKTRLLDALDSSVRPSSVKSSTSTTSTLTIHGPPKKAGSSTSSSTSTSTTTIDQLKALCAEVTSFGLAFAEASAVAHVIAAADAVRGEIQALLGQDKVSVPAIRLVLAKVAALPVDLSDDVAPLKVKMTSAQKWLERARKCMPPTKRFSSRITDTPHGASTTSSSNPRAKMHLDAVHELVQCAPVDDQSSEMQEMEDLLAYADAWGARVDAAMTVDEDLPIDMLRELLEEGQDMPVVMERTTALEAWIDAREWEATALAATKEDDRRGKRTADGCSLDELHALLDDAKEIRGRLKHQTWRPRIEATIQSSVTTAEAWIGQTQQLLGMPAWSKMFAGNNVRGGRGPDRRTKGVSAGVPSADTATTTTSTKRSLAELKALVAQLQPPEHANTSTDLEHLDGSGGEDDRRPVREAGDGDATDNGKTTCVVDLSEFVSPLKALISRGDELMATCSALDVTAATAYDTARGLVEAMDAFPCHLEGHALREKVAVATTWRAAVLAVCETDRTKHTGGNHASPTPYASRRVIKKSSLYETSTTSTSTTSPAPAPPLTSRPSTTLDDLRALEATTLAFPFPDERARIRDEIAAVVAWQAQVRDALHSDVATTALAACRQLEALDGARCRPRDDASRDTATTDRYHDEDVHVAMAQVLVTAPPPDKTAVDEDTTKMGAADDDSKAATVALGDALVNVIQVISGCRTKQADQNNSDTRSSAMMVAVEWSPMLSQIDRSLAYIASLDAKAKQEDDDHDHPSAAATADAHKQTLEAVAAWKAQLESLLSSSNAIVSTFEATAVTWLLHALEWLVATRSYDEDDDSEDTATSVIARGNHLRSTCPTSGAVEGFNHDDMMHEWRQATLWPLHHLEAQRAATAAWEASLEAQMSTRTLTLGHIDAVLSEADAVQADDRPVWVELRKVKTWLVKAKKVLKAKQTAKLPLHTLGSLVDEGGKLKIRTGVWAALEAEHDAAAQWEAKLKASGLDVGQAKIATLVQLLAEFDARKFVVDMDMHRDVLVSATEQYCICRQPYDGFMLGCDLCDDWFHDTCVGISKEKAEKVADYVCPSCGLLVELKRLVSVADETATTSELLANESTHGHDKALSVALRKVKKEERDVDKSTVALVELHAQVTALGQHVAYLEKMLHDNNTVADKGQPSNGSGALPSLLQHNHLHHHHPPPTSAPPTPHASMHPLFKGYPPPSLLRTLPPFPSSSSPSQPLQTLQVPSQHFLQPMPPHQQQTASPSHHHHTHQHHGGGLTLPPLPSSMNASTASPLHLLLAKPTSSMQASPAAPSSQAGSEETTAAAPGPTNSAATPASSYSTVSSQEIELTRFKMEHYKLKQMAVEAEAALTQSKDRLRLARAAVDSLVTTRDVWRPKAQHWWQQVQFVLAQLVVDKKAFDLRLLAQWAAECEAFCDAFPAVLAMKKVLHAIPWTIDVFTLLHGTPKPAYEALEAVLAQTNQVHEPKVLLPLRGVLQRTDQWKARTQKSVVKLLAAKKVETAKIQHVLNEYLKMPVTCAWGRKLEALVVELETRDPVFPPPTIDVTPPPSPRLSLATAPSDATATLKRKPSKSSTGGSARKRSKGADGDVAKKAKASNSRARTVTSMTGPDVV
ncbi:hypothetical protein, variant [Aphanomyces astaci]|uniref:PHD-type domain-containing protein n=1 Tax=Aphanomyces astaci TaxID=112090 RepID=W4FPC4_APHAT|nr:hypothetical protein, variant [Aphanomyces astaci]ETV68791.1 hypothetical protein, variant [Aphanomyces astaci]|eukprot:XP_009841745.1 hypothetical protein, variant [Aphanomyces astaci]